MDDFADLIENEDTDEGDRPSYFKPEAKGITRRKVKRLYKTAGGAHATRDWNFLGMTVLSPEITFTRSGATATRVNPNKLIEVVAADTPRFDYDPITGAARGLLIEELSVNLALRSEDLTDAVAWVKTRSSISANAIAAPDGATTADKIVEDATASNTHFVQQNFSKAASALPYAHSIFLKAGERTEASVYLGDGTLTNYCVITVNLSTGAVVSGPTANGTFTAAGGSVQKFANGWYRVTILGTSDTQLVLSTAVYISVASSASYSGNGTSGIYAWGEQLEQKAFQTSYVPTAAAAVTRNVDNAAVIGANFSAFFNPLAGTAVVEWMIPTPDITNVRIASQIDDGGALNECIRHNADAAGNQVNNQIISGGSASFSQSFSTPAILVTHKQGFAWQANDARAAFNNVLSALDNTITVPTVNRWQIGGRGSTSANNLNGWVQRIRYWNSRLPDAQLQALTA